MVLLMDGDLLADCKTALNTVDRGVNISGTIPDHMTLFIELFEASPDDGPRADPDVLLLFTGNADDLWTELEDFPFRWVGDQPLANQIDI